MHCIAFLVVMLAFVSVPGEAAAELFTQEKCSLCHILDSRFLEADSALAGALRAEGEKRVCFSCHNGTVANDRDTLWLGSQHPPPSGKKGPCSACHSPHGNGGWKVLAGTSVPLRTGGNALCLGCHKSHAPGDGAIHKTGFPAGGCKECHRAHGGSGPYLLKGSEEQLCLRCHIAMDSALRGGHSWKTVSAKSGSAPPPCSSCHPVHKPGKTGKSPSALCGECHGRYVSSSAEGAGIHPGVGECLTCHTVHMRSDESGRAFRGADMQPVLLCGKCHPGEIAETREKARERGTHSSFSEGKGICFRCHRIHSPAPQTRLLATEKPYFCLDCHQDQNTIVQSGEVSLAHPVFEYVARKGVAEVTRKKKFLLGARGELVCRTCHILHRSEPGTPLLPKGTRGEESCLYCHEEKTGKEHRSGPGGTVNASCNECHSVHGQKGTKSMEKVDRGGIKDPDRWAAVCHVCHKEKSRHLAGREDRTISRGKGLPSFDLHGRRADKTGGISCPTCHDPHGPPSEGNRLRKPYEPSGFLCTSCHVQQETIALTPHDLRGLAGKSPCEPCHVPHAGTLPWMWGLPRGGGEPGEEACRKCHEGKGMGAPVPKGGHPRNMIPSRSLPARFPLLGPGGAPSKNGVISCPTCHAVHGTGLMPTGQGVGKLLRVSTPGTPASICSECHVGKVEGHGKADCTVCHPPHSGESGESACGKCHGDRQGTLMARHRGAGKGCGSCHRIHRGPTGGKQAMERDRAEGCFECHANVRRVTGTPHADMGEGCKPCHPMHTETSGFTMKPKLGEELFLPDLTCLRCHRDGGDASIPKWSKHPNHTKEVPTSYGAKVKLETPVMMVGRHKEAGKPLFPLFDDAGKQAMSGRMGCLTCHDPHAGGKSGPEGGAKAYLRDPSFLFLAEMCTPCHRSEGTERIKGFHTRPRGDS